ncbi:MAG: ADP-ribosylglycohydrolase family protein [Candidatus Thorarchaeota archaeon]
MVKKKDKFSMREISYKQYYNKVLGSWIGRIAGDFVGAPVEFMPYFDIKSKYGKITYFPEPINLSYVNDDEMYEICALIALEKKGINLTSKDIAEEWINLLYKMNYTAEKVALDNLRAGIWPPESGRFNNEYFDAIGAQMRADIWGQITPGCPIMAKKYAEIDGCISHSGIGIEGEIFIAVLISQAFFEKNIQKNIQMALEFIPKKENSLYTQFVLKAMDIYSQFPENYTKGRRELIRFWNKVRKDLVKDTPINDLKRLSFLTEIKPDIHTPDVHVLPNIGIIILSLLYGAKNNVDPLGKSICISAMMGLDTDCNCGNIGAILGAQIGAKEIPQKWSDPLKDTFSTFVKGYEKWKITDLARKVSEIGFKVIDEKCRNQIKIIK